jgi:hypothetical protein
MKPKRIVLYASVSTRDKGQDTRNQLAQLRDFCAKQEWTVTVEYVDQASGKTGDRPQFKAMLDAAAQREFDLVLFWSLDRICREGVLETLQYLRTLTSYGVGWKSFTEQYLNSCGIFRDAALSILATVAKQERVRLSERTRSPPKWGWPRPPWPGSRGSRRYEKYSLGIKPAGCTKGAAAAFTRIDCYRQLDRDLPNFQVARRERPGSWHIFELTKRQLKLLQRGCHIV